MSVLSYQSIKDYCLGMDLIKPWAEQTIHNGKSYGLSSCGYDIRIKQDVVLYPCDFWTWFCNLWGAKRKSFVLASTVEYFKIPYGLKMDVYDKSSWAREGLAVQNTTAEPGWRGYLTLELANHGPNKIVIKAGTPIAQVQFEHLDKLTILPYKGKYQDQPDKPVESIYQI